MRKVSYYFKTSWSILNNELYLFSNKANGLNHYKIYLNDIEQYIEINSSPPTSNPTFFSKRPIIIVGFCVHRILDMDRHFIFFLHQTYKWWLSYILDAVSIQLKGNYYDLVNRENVVSPNKIRFCYYTQYCFCL